MIDECPSRRLGSLATRKQGVRFDIGEVPIRQQPHEISGIQVLIEGRQARDSDAQTALTAEGAKLADRSDLAAHLSTEQLNAIEGPYRYVARMDTLAGDEKAGLLALQRSRYGAGRLTPQDSAEISDAIDMLQFSNRAFAGSAWALLQAGKAAPGGGLPDDQKRLVLEQAHDVYGSCVTEYVPGNAYGGRQVYKQSGNNIFQGI